jgi:cytochrome P450
MKRVSVGEVKALFSQYGADAWLELALRHGKTFRLQQFVVTCDTRLVEPLMLDRAHTQRRSTAHKVIQRITPGSAGLLFLDGPDWEVQRRAVAPTFTRENVQRHAEFVHASALQWARECHAGDDLFTAVTRLGASIVVETGYGSHPSHPAACEFADELVGYKQQTMNRDPRCRLDVLGIDAGKVLALPWLAATLLNLHRRVARMRRLVPRMLDGRATCPARKPNWLDGLAAEDLSLNQLTDALNHLYGAYNAVDFVVTAALLELSRHPEWRERVRCELTAVLGARAYPTLDDISHVPVLWGVIKETLRLYPVAMGIFRQTGAPLEVDGERLPTGTQVVILPHALHRHPAYWDEPLAFRPDRWARSPSAPFAYIPFLIGPRKCMGQPLAELELLIRVSTIIRTADLHVDVESASLTPFLVPRFATDLPFRLTHPIGITTEAPECSSMQPVPTSTPAC